MFKLLLQNVWGSIKKKENCIWGIQEIFQFVYVFFLDIHNTEVFLFYTVRHLLITTVRYIIPYRYAQCTAQCTCCTCTLYNDRILLNGLYVNHVNIKASNPNLLSSVMFIGLRTRLYQGSRKKMFLLMAGPFRGGGGTLGTFFQRFNFPTDIARGGGGGGGGFL